MQYRDLAISIMKEIRENKNILLRIPAMNSIVSQNDADEGSDSNPSEDDLDEKERSLIIPTELLTENTLKDVKEKKRVVEKNVVQNYTRAVSKRRNIIKKNLNRTMPQRNDFAYIDMVDDWTQTPLREDNKEKELQKNLNTQGLLPNETKSLLGAYFNYDRAGTQKVNGIGKLEDIGRLNKVIPYRSNGNSSLRARESHLRQATFPIRGVGMISVTFAQ